MWVWKSPATRRGLRGYGETISRGFAEDFRPVSRIELERVFLIAEDGYTQLAGKERSNPRSKRISIRPRELQQCRERRVKIAWQRVGPPGITHLDSIDCGLYLFEGRADTDTERPRHGSSLPRRRHQR